MTIGELSRRSGVSIKALREYERLGLLYTLGRSVSNYRLFDESALWCLQVVQTLRSLGLTLEEIQEISLLYCQHPRERIGHLLAGRLERVLVRTDRRLQELTSLRQRVLEFQAAHAAALKGQASLAIYSSDPRRETAEFAS